MLTGKKENFLDKVPFERSNVWLHKNVIDDFLKLKELAKAEGIELSICSAYRNYQRQLTIWNEKALGLRPLYNLEHKLVDPTTLDPEVVLSYLLRWSAIPGASRHHWGTDMDVYDQSALNDDYQLQLSPVEYNQPGLLYQFNLWLTQILKSKNNCGFFRPYQKDLGGVSPEPWHISHQKVASDFYNHFDLDVFIKNLEDPAIELRDLLLKDPEYYFQTYVKNVSAN